MVRSHFGITAFFCQAVLVQCKPQEGLHVGPASLPGSMHNLVGSSHATAPQPQSQVSASAVPTVSFADVSAPQALAALQSDASAADQGTDDAISDFLGGLSVPTPEPLVPEATHHVKVSAESDLHAPRHPIDAASKAIAMPPTTAAPKKAVATKHPALIAKSMPLETKVDRAELKKEMRAELKDELTKEILEEQKHKDSAGKTAHQKVLVTGHKASEVRFAALSETLVAQASQSRSEVAAERETVASRKKAGVGSESAVQSKTVASSKKAVSRTKTTVGSRAVASQSKATVGTKAKASHAKGAELKVDHVSSAAQSKAVVQQARHLKVTFDTKAVVLPLKAAPIKAVEDWFGTVQVPKLEHQIPKRSSLASTASSNVLGLDQRVRDLRGELFAERALREEAAAVASKKTGRPEADWSPAAPQSSALGDWKDQVVVLEAELQEERHLREDAAEAAEHAAPTVESSVLPAAAKSTTVAPAEQPPAPKGLPFLLWQHAALNYPDMSVIARDLPHAKKVAPQGFFAATRQPPQGFLAALRDGFVWVTGGKLQWLFVGAAPKQAPETADLVQTGSSAPTPLRLGHSLQFPATRKQEFAKVAAATRRDQLQSISLGATFLEMEDQDAVDEENLRHADAYMRSTAETAEAPHEMSDKERADRRRESVHISDVWLNLEQQDSDISQALDNMGPETNLNKMGDIDSIQDQSMAALTRQVDSAGDASRDSQLRVSNNVASSDFVHEPFEQLQLADEDAETQIRLDPNMRRE